LAMMQTFQPPQMFAPSAPQLPPPPPMHTQSPSVFVPSWLNPPAHPKRHTTSHRTSHRHHRSKKHLILVAQG
jgi:hypothetical protein